MEGAIGTLGGWICPSHCRRVSAPESLALMLVVAMIKNALPCVQMSSEGIETRH